MDADEGKTIKVKVFFTDDRDFEETLISEPTAAVEAAEESASTWSAELTVGSSGSFYGYWESEGSENSRPMSSTRKAKPTRS